MAWTTPKTYTVGELLTAADMNLYQRDNLEAGFPYGTTWQTYTPQLTASTTSPTLGSGSTQNGRYYRVGQLVTVHFKIGFGTSGTAAGSGNYAVSIPVSASASAPDDQRVGLISLYDNSATTHRVGFAFLPGSNRSVVQLVVDSATSVVTASSPWAWAASDFLDGVLTYEAA